MIAPSFQVFSGDFQLLLLRRGTCRLLRSPCEPDGILPLPDPVPQIHQLLHVSQLFKYFECLLFSISNPGHLSFLFVCCLSRYVVGFVWFVLSLVKRYYMRQFSLFAWTHVALLIVVSQSYLIIQVII